jgi:hypothetical protein
VWEASQASDNVLRGVDFNQWHELIGGVRWYRWTTMRKEKYYQFVIEDKATAGSLADLDDLQDYEFPLQQQQASWWAASSTFPLTARFWKDVLAEEPVEVDSGKTETDEETAENVAPTGPINLGQRWRDPVVTSAREARYTKNGAYAWPVKMTVQDVQAQTSWIIQKVVLDDPKTQATFWEAFPVDANQADATYQDIYQGNAKKSKGQTTVIGLMQHHAFGGGPPPGMTAGGSQYAADDQISTSTQPPFWGDGGTPHDIKYIWGAFATEFTTVPPAEAVQKQHHWEVGAG